MTRPRATTRAGSARPVLLAAVLLFVILLCAAGFKSYRDLTVARARERQLESRIQETRSGIDRLRGRIERLRSDPGMLERLAREELGLVRRQDVVIELPVPPAAARDARAATGPATAQSSPAAARTAPAADAPAAAPPAPAPRRP